MIEHRDELLNCRWMVQKHNWIRIDYYRRRWINCAELSKSCNVIDAQQSMTRALQRVVDNTITTMIASIGSLTDSQEEKMKEICRPELLSD